LRLPLILVLAAVVAMLVASRVRAAARAIPPQAPLEIDRVSGELRLTASVRSSAPPPDLVVASKDSPHAHSALFVSDSTCDEVRTALATLGLDGDGGGAPVALHVQWPGSGGRHPVAGILAEGEPGSARLDFRFCRNAGLDESDVGCIVRVASPGRPSSDQGTVSRSIADRLPRPGTTVVLTLRK
jgi:hypothetical protein